ncbi:MAG: twin-arginine translocation signal domain-containing protein, partial [Chloroflexi bacterium]
MKSRRSFLKNASLVATAAITARPLLGWAADSGVASQGSTVVPGADGMIVRSLRFL